MPVSPPLTELNLLSRHMSIQALNERSATCKIRVCQSKHTQRRRNGLESPNTIWFFAESNGKITESERAELEAAKAEVARLRKVKEDYLEAHPEEREALNAKNEAAQAARTEKERDSKTVNILGIRISYREKREAEKQGLRFDRNGRLVDP